MINNFKMTKLSFTAVALVLLLSACGGKKTIYTQAAQAIVQAADAIGSSTSTGLPVSLTDNTGTLTSGSGTYPASFSEPIPGLGQSANYYFGLISGVGPNRAVVKVGKYFLGFTARSATAASNYTLSLPASVNWVPGISSNCAQSMTGSINPGETKAACIEFTVPTIGANITPYALPISLTIGSVTDKLWVLVIPGGDISIQLANNSYVIPPLVVRQEKFRTDTNVSMNRKTVIQSEFDVRVYQSGQVVSNATVAFKNSAAGTAYPIGNGIIHVKVAIPGPQVLVLNANGSSAEQLIAVPRQLSIQFTTNDPSRNDDMYNNGKNETVAAQVISNVPGTVNFSVKGTGGTASMSVSAYGKAFSPEHYPGYVTNSYMGNRQVGDLTLSLDGNVPLGAITAYAVVQRCPGESYRSILDAYYVFNEIM